jgi:ParB family chromosome partitioning protein
MSQTREVNPEDVPIGEQVRQSYEPKALAELAESIKTHGILQLPTLSSSGKPIDGHHRILAARMAGLKTITVAIDDSPEGAVVSAAKQLATSIHHVDFSDAEVFIACMKIKAEDPGMKNVELAGLLSKDPSYVTRLLAINNLIPDAKKAFLEGAFRLAAAYDIAKLPRDQQAGFLAQKLGKASGKPVRGEATEKPTTRRAPKRGGKVSKASVLLPSGYTVTVSGGSTALSLDDLAAAVAEVAKEIKKAKELGYSVSTLIKASADKSAKGGV